MDYLTRDPRDTPDEQQLAEEPNPDVNSLDFMRLNTSLFGPEFERDNHDLFTLLRIFLTGTDGWNVVSKYQKDRNGRAAHLALRAHYKGLSFHHLLKSRANSMMTKTFYRGDNTKFNWENL